MAKGNHILSVQYGPAPRDYLVLDFETDEHRDV